MQRLGKQTSAIRKLYFLCGPRRAKARRNKKSVDGQRNGKHTSTTMEDGVFRGVRAKELS
jgi:hypothetical protein